MRTHFYRCVRDLWAYTGKPRGKALVLAGQEAADVGPLIHLLGYKPSDIWLVDWEESEALNWARSVWPGLNTYAGDVRNVIGATGKLGLVNLDFCGHLTPGRRTIVQQASEFMSDGAVCSYTFLRGREQEMDSAMRYILARKGEFFLPHRGNKGASIPDQVRFEYHTQEVGRLLGRAHRGQIKPFFKAQYSKPQPGFGVVAFQRAGTALASTKKFKLFHQNNERRKIQIFRADGADKNLEALEGQLMVEGLSERQVSITLNLR